MYPCQYALLFISKLINNIFFYKIKQKIFKQLRSCNANYNDDHYYKFIFVQCIHIGNFHRHCRSELLL